jgi:hypothetical protein
VRPATVGIDRFGKMQSTPSTGRIELNVQKLGGFFGVTNWILTAHSCPA